MSPDVPIPSKLPRSLSAPVLPSALSPLPNPPAHPNTTPFLCIDCPSARPARPARPSSPFFLGPFALDPSRLTTDPELVCFSSCHFLFFYNNHYSASFAPFSLLFGLLPSYVRYALTRRNRNKTKKGPLHATRYAVQVAPLQTHPPSTSNGVPPPVHSRLAGPPRLPRHPDPKGPPLFVLLLQRSPRGASRKEELREAS